MIEFPDPRDSDENGLLAVGGELTTENLLSAYSQGIFPWPQEGFPLLWFSPLERGVLHFDHFHIPKSVEKELKKKKFTITLNKDFDTVIENCSRVPRSEQDGTWILPEMLTAYKELHEKGYAHSLECWSGGEVVGGLYGLYVEGVFSGESMFHRESGASKACLIFLIDHLKTLGNQWMDIQMVTPLLELFGGEYMERDEFLTLLKQSQVKRKFL